MTDVLAASNNYVVVKTDEEVRLIFKNQSRPSIVIGDFYGDAEAAVIDVNQKFVATVGCGLIVYFLEEPFTEYQYDTKTLQWVEYGREKEQTLWLRNVRQLSPDTIEALDDQGRKHRFAFSVTPQQNNECTLIYPSCELANCRTIGHYHGFGYDTQCAFDRQPIATSYFSPIYTDEQEYTITVLKEAQMTPQAYKIVSEISGKNYLTVKKEMDEAPLPVFSGKAREVLLCIRKLKECGASIRVSPDFPYTDEDLWQEE